MNSRRHRCRSGVDCPFCEEVAELRAFEADLPDDAAADRRAGIEEDRWRTGIHE